MINNTAFFSLTDFGYTQYVPTFLTVTMTFSASSYIFEKKYERTSQLVW